jgi:hypothetical protein
MSEKEPAADASVDIERITYRKRIEVFRACLRRGRSTHGETVIAAETGKKLPV